MLLEVLQIDVSQPVGKGGLRNKKSEQGKFRQARVL